MKGNGLVPSKFLSRQNDGKWLSGDCTAVSLLQRSAHMHTPGLPASKPPINGTNPRNNTQNKMIIPKHLWQPN
jgi:hypothetical protein